MFLVWSLVSVPADTNTRVPPLSRLSHHILVLQWTEGAFGRHEVELGFLKLLVDDKEVGFGFCDTNHQLAGFFPGPLDETKPLFFRNQLLKKACGS